MFITIILAALFALLGVVFAAGKGSFLIAGYNTSSAKEKAKYNEKRLTRCCSVICFGIALDYHFACISFCGYRHLL